MNDMNRRRFISRAAAASAAMALMPSLACANADRKTGLILYTVRNEMRKDSRGTLDSVAEAGFNWIEAADYSEGLFHGMKPADFRKAVESRGMELISSHNGLNPDNLEKVIGDAGEAGLKYLVLPSLPRNWSSSLDGYREAAEFMNIAGEECGRAGIKFGFHNHSVEFTPIEGVVPFDILLAETDPEKVIFELDLAWITKAGQDPLEYFRKGSGRFELFHAKDLSPEGEDATIGEGTIDFKPLFDASATAGMKYFFIEQDNCRTHPPLESIVISRKSLLSQVG